MGEPISRQEFKTELRDALAPLVKSGEATAVGLKTVSDEQIEIKTNQTHIKASLEKIDTRLAAGDKKFEEQHVAQATLETTVKAHETRLDAHSKRLAAHDKRSLGGGGIGGITVYGVLEVIRRALGFGS